MGAGDGDAEYAPVDGELVGNRAGDAVGDIVAEVEVGEPLAEVPGSAEGTLPATLGAARERDQPLATSPEVSRMSDEGRDPVPTVETGVRVPGLAAVLPGPVPERFCDRTGWKALGR